MSHSVSSEICDVGGWGACEVLGEKNGVGAGSGAAGKRNDGGEMLDGRIEIGRRCLSGCSRNRSVEMLCCVEIE